jgi:uncharacterized membrane protein YcaP (DUF421 family)
VANAVQNGIIGDDDSVTGGVLGASALFVLNGALAVVLFRRSKLRRLAEGTPRTLISMGVVDHEALRKERLTEDQLMAAIATQGAGGLDDVAEAVLPPQRNDRDTHEGDGPRRQALHGPHEAAR